MRLRLGRAVAPILCLLVAAAPAPSRRARPASRAPGLSPDHVTLLPNGWSIAPVGRHLTIGDLPLAMAESPDGRFVVVTNNGWTRPTLRVVDLARLVVSATPTDNAWLGLAWSPSGDRIYSSGAAANVVNEFRFEKEKLTAVGQFSIPPLSREPDAPAGAEADEEKKGPFVGGLCVSVDAKSLYAVNVLGLTLSRIDLASRGAARSIELPAEPYTGVLSPDGKTLAVSLWGGAKVLLFDPATLEKVGEIAVGEHPNAMVFSRDGARLFVACANTNAVWALDVARRAAVEQIGVALYPGSPAGSTPNALGLSPDGSTLLVANADNNCVAVVDVRQAEKSRVSGFIPTGWYPTAAQFTRDGKRILILSGKGLTSLANPRGPQPAIPAAEGQTTRALFQGSLTIVTPPDGATLAEWTRRVYRLTPYADRTRLAPAHAPAGSPIPARVGAPSPIRYVFYVIRENRTYDQILGDAAEGNGDRNLCLFGEDVTPNAHALAREFVLFDNFYVDAEVSYDGHAFSTGAYATDAVEKIWPMNYAQRGGLYLSEGGYAMRNAYGNLAAPAAGYLWDACARAGISVRSYGEFVQAKTPPPSPTPPAPHEPVRGGYRPSVPGLEGRIDPDYPPFDLAIPDGRRVDVWLEEFRGFERNGNLPRLSIIRLPGDHTNYTKAGYPTPRAMIAENDLALGRLVESISKSRYWKESAIFVLEDDAQNGPDHVDAHRSVALVASPYARRRAVDSTLYTTCGMLRTMELLLGLPPMSQYDAAATPFYAAFRAQPDVSPFTHVPARVPIDERNAADAPGAAASLAVDLSQADRAPDVPFNEILWKSVRGAGSKMPPPVHAAFVRPLAAQKDEDD